MKSSCPDKNPSRSSYVALADVDCPVCEEGGHEASGCPSFLRNSPGDRLQAAIRARLCFVCLRTGHITRECPTKTACRVCGCNQWHATPLHEANWSQFQRESQQRRLSRESEPFPEAPSEQPEAPSEQPPIEGSGHYSTSFHVRGSKVALPLLPVKVSSLETGMTVETYTLLDSGSNISLCQDHCWSC